VRAIRRIVSGEDLGRDEVLKSVKELLPVIEECIGEEQTSALCRSWEATCRAYA